MAVGQNRRKLGFWPRKNGGDHKANRGQEQEQQPHRLRALPSPATAISTTSLAPTGTEYIDIYMCVFIYTEKNFSFILFKSYKLRASLVNPFELNFSSLNSTFGVWCFTPIQTLH